MVVGMFTCNTPPLADDVTIAGPARRACASHVS
jgi:hypothetical protein